MVKIAVNGALGRMGGGICRLVMDNPETELAGAIDRMSGKIEGADIEVVTDPASGMRECDVVIDFSAPEASSVMAAECVSQKKGLVIGTTGLDDSQIGILEKAAADIPLVYSPNMSVGVNLMFRIVREITKRLPDYEKELVESHHNRKVDSPSGTAMKIARLLAGEKGRLVYGRQGSVGPRKSDEVGVFAVRGGNIVGEHTALWIGKNDRIELTHRAQSRDIFIEGAVRAAIWLNNAAPGRLYSMEDVLS